MKPVIYPRYVTQPVQGVGFVPLLAAVPLWAWITGGAIAGGAAVYTATKPDGQGQSFSSNLGEGIGKGVGNAILWGAVIYVGWKVFSEHTSKSKK